MKQYRVYFLDFDGTLFDTLDSLVEIYNAGFRYLGYEIGREEASRYMHVSLEETAKLAKVPANKALKWGMLIAGALETDAAIREVKPYPDVIPFLEKMETLGYKASIVTGNTASHVQKVLAHNKMERFFDGIYSGADYKPKPAPDALLAGIASYKGLSKKDCVYVGDSLQDPECARNALVDGILLDRHDEYGDYQGTKIKTLADLLL